MESVEMLGKDIYVCVHARGKKFKWERLKYMYAKMFTPRTCTMPIPKAYIGIYMPMYNYTYTYNVYIHLMVHTEECLGTECSSLFQQSLLQRQWCLMADTSLTPLHVFPQSSLHSPSSPGHLKLPLSSSTRKVKTSIKNVLKSMKKRFH